MNSEDKRKVATHAARKALENVAVVLRTEAAIEKARCNCSECRPDLVPREWNGARCPGAVRSFV